MVDARARPGVAAAGSYNRTMSPLRHLAPCLLLALATLPARAAEADAASRGAAEPKVQRSVVEDDNARIEELRVRGQTQRIVVRSKRGGGSTYEVIPGDAAREMSAGHGSTRGAAGQRVWNVMSF